MASSGPFVPIALLVLAAFVLLTLVTFSLPLGPRALYFLHASGVRFGGWGFCPDNTAACSPTKLGYAWPPVIVYGMTKTLVFYPTAAILSVLTLLTLLPAFCRPRRVYPIPMHTLMVWITFLTSVVAFAFMIAVFASARDELRREQESATFGPLPWLSLAATVCLGIVAIHAACVPANVYYL